MRPRPRRRIAVITGTRADFGVLRSTIQALRARRDVQLRVIATGMHLLPRFGYTLRDVQREFGPVAARVRMQRGDDAPLDQALGLARGVSGIAKALLENRSELVLVLGDRIEAMAGALAAVTSGRFLAHIHGGDLAAGDFDDALRDAITQLADLHLVASDAAAKRVRSLGAAAGRVVRVGAPGLDLLREPHQPAEQRWSSDDAFWQDAALVVYHAHGRSRETEAQVMTNVLEAVRAARLRRVIIYPNTDRGNAGVISAIKTHLSAHARGGAADASAFRSVPHDRYARWLRAARVLVGNSSSGIIEAPFVGTPSVNVGQRQAGRVAGGPSVLHAGESQPSIARAVRRALQLPRRRSTRVYGDGRAGARIARILATIRIDERG